MQAKDERVGSTESKRENAPLGQSHRWWWFGTCSQFTSIFFFFYIGLFFFFNFFLCFCSVCTHAHRLPGDDLWPNTYLQNDLHLYRPSEGRIPKYCGDF